MRAETEVEVAVRAARRDALLEAADVLIEQARTASEKYRRRNPTSRRAQYRLRSRKLRTAGVFAAAAQIRSRALSGAQAGAGPAFPDLLAQAVAEFWDYVNEHLDDVTGEQEDVIAEALKRFDATRIWDGDGEPSSPGNTAVWAQQTVSLPASAIAGRIAAELRRTRS